MAPEIEMTAATRAATSGFRAGASSSWPRLAACLARGFRFRPRQPRRTPALGDFADSRIASADELARPECHFLEIGRIGGKNLPVRGFRPEQTNGTHPRKLAAETRVMLGRRGQPYTVVDWRVVAVAQDHHDFLLDVYRKAAEHRLRSRGKADEGIEHELVRHAPAQLAAEYLGTGRIAIRPGRCSGHGPCRRASKRMSRRRRSSAGSDCRRPH